MCRLPRVSGSGQPVVVVVLWLKTQRRDSSHSLKPSSISRWSILHCITLRIKKLLRNTQKNFHPQLPKRPKQKNSCSKMWLIDQLYKKLGSEVWTAPRQHKIEPCESLNLNSLSRDCWLETVKDFLKVLDMKSHMHLIWMRPLGNRLPRSRPRRIT